MREVTVVTGFFDIGREGWGAGFSRSSHKYMSYFEFWARINNNLIVFTEPKYKETIEKIRAKYGLSDKTHVVAISDLTEVDPVMYQAIKGALSRPEAVSFRDAPECPESYNAYYDYIVCIKSVLVNKAIDLGLAKGMVAWLDFGYNHGGEYFQEASEFDFTWRTDLPEKINVFALEDDDQVSLFEIVRSMKVYLSGGLILAPAILWRDMQDLIRRAVESLSDCGLADDDQTVTLMAQRKRPDLFNTIPVECWFDPLIIASKHNFTVKKVERVKFVRHKLAKRSALRAWRQGSYMHAVKDFGKYIFLKLIGK